MAFKKLNTSKSTTTGPLSKFKKRNKETLEKTWSRRSKQSEGSSGKSIYNKDKLDKYGIQILGVDTKKEGEYYFNILPQSFDENVAYHEEVAIHYNVGIRNDNLICMERYTEGKQDCHRCTVQKEGWRKYGKDDKKIKDILKGMYPQDKVVYLLENLGPKYLKDEDPDGILYIKDFPKKGVHAKIQDEVRDKKTGRMIDIADMGDEGRLVYMKVSVKHDKDSGNTFPEYGSFDLMDRDQPPDSKVLTKLEELIEDAEAEGMTAIQFLLHFPEDDEVKDSMKTEIFDFGDDKNEPSSKEEKKGERLSKKQETKKVDDEVNLEELEEVLSEMKTSFQLKRFCKENNIEDIIDSDMSKEEIVEAILTYFSEKD